MTPRRFVFIAAVIGMAMALHGYAMNPASIADQVAAGILLLLLSAVGAGLWRPLARARREGRLPMNLPLFLIIGALAGGVMYGALWLIPVTPQAPKDKPLSAEQEGIRRAITNLAHELRLASGREFREECVLTGAERLGVAKQPATVGLLLPNVQRTVVRSLMPLATAFAEVETGFLFQDNLPEMGGRRVRPGYVAVVAAYQELLGKPWVISADRYVDGRELTPWDTCIYGIRPIDHSALDRLIGSLTQAEKSDASETEARLLERARRTLFRNEIGEMLGRATITRTSVLTIARFPDGPQKHEELKGQWQYAMDLKMKSISFVAQQLGDQADAQRMMFTEPSTQYPDGIKAMTQEGMLWDDLTTLIKRFEELLQRYPAL